MQRSRHTRRASLSVAGTAHAVQDGLTVAIFVLLPILAQTFGLSYAQVGLLKGLRSLSHAALELASGWFSEHIGAVRLIVLGLLLSGLGYLLVSIAPGLTAVALGFLVIGVGTACHHAPATALIAGSHDATTRGQALGLYNAAGDVGKLALTGGVSLAVGAGLVWQQVTLAYVVLAVAAAVAVTLFGVRGAARGGTPDREARAATSLAPATVPARGWGILDKPAFGAVLLITSLDTIVQTAVMLFLAFLMLAKGVPLGLATAATVILLTGGTFGKAACGYLADRLGTARAFTVVQLATAAGLFGLVFAPAWVAFALLAPLGAVVQGSSTVTYGLAADLIHPDRMARGYALLYATGTAAAAAGPLVLGLLADAAGIDAAFHAMALVTLLTIPPIMFLRPRTAARG